MLNRRISINSSIISDIKVLFNLPNNALILFDHLRWYQQEVAINLSELSLVLGYQKRPYTKQADKDGSLHQNAEKTKIHFVDNNSI